MKTFPEQSLDRAIEEIKFLSSNGISFDVSGLHRPYSESGVPTLHLTFIHSELSREQRQWVKRRFGPFVVEGSNGWKYHTSEMGLEGLRIVVTYSGALECKIVGEKTETKTVEKAISFETVTEEVSTPIWECSPAGGAEDF